MDKNLKFVLFSIILVCLVASTLGAVGVPEMSDKRCKCICPRVNGRAVFIQNVIPERCNCDHVVLPSLPEQADASEFCAKCQCKHENRNSVTIKIVVIAFVVVTGLLMIYMVYLLVEARLCKGSKALAEETSNVAYEQHLDEEEFSPREGSSEERFHGGTSLRARFNAQMTKWKKAVMQQRGNVYIRRTVLNN